MARGRSQELSAAVSPAGFVAVPSVVGYDALARFPSPAAVRPPLPANGHTSLLGQSCAGAGSHGHFTQEANEAQRLSDFLKVTRQSGYRTQLLWLQVPGVPTSGRQPAVHKAVPGHREGPALG